MSRYDEYFNVEGLAEFISEHVSCTSCPAQDDCPREDARCVETLEAWLLADDEE